MAVSLTMGKVCLSILCGCVGISWATHSTSPAVLLIQTSMHSKVERHPPPITVTIDRGELVISPGPIGKSFNDQLHPPNNKRSKFHSDGAYDPGYLGDHSNVLQWIMNAVIYAEVENIPRIRLNPEVHQFLKADMLPGLQREIEIDRKEGRIEKNPVSSTCGTIDWDQCRVNITVRAKIAEYYFKPLLPADCGNPQYEGLVIHLRRPESILENYMQPPCQLYAFVIDQDKYTSIRVFGEPQNPCAEWLMNYSKDNGIEMENVVGRSFQEDFCEAAHAKNFALGISTMSQNAVLLGGNVDRHLYQMIPPQITDPFMYFGLQTKYFEQLCDVFDATGLALDDASYWDMSLDMAKKMQSQTLGVKAMPCK